jgi:hypothetical protein
MPVCYGLCKCLEEPISSLWCETRMPFVFMQQCRKCSLSVARARWMRETVADG